MLTFDFSFCHSSADIEQVLLEGLHDSVVFSGFYQAADYLAKYSFDGVFVSRLIYCSSVILRNISSGRPVLYWVRIYDHRVGAASKKHCLSIQIVRV